METTIYTSGIQCATKNVVTYTGKVFHTTAANQHDAVFLQVVALTGNVCIDLFLIGEAYTGNLTHC